MAGDNAYFKFFKNNKRVNAEPVRYNSKNAGLNSVPISMFRYAVVYNTNFEPDHSAYPETHSTGPDIPRRSDSDNNFLQGGTYPPFT